MPSRFFSENFPIQHRLNNKSIFKKNLNFVQYAASLFRRVETIRAVWHNDFLGAKSPQMAFPKTTCVNASAKIA
jgi:hypothetical protein